MMASWTVPADLELVDIKFKMYSHEDLAELYRLSGSYESLFSKRSQNFIAKGLKDTITDDSDYGKLLPSDYTFLKRPVLVYDDNIFVGNSAQTSQAIKVFLDQID